MTDGGITVKTKLLSLVLTACLLCAAVPVTAQAAFCDIPDPETALAAGVLQSMGIVSGVGQEQYSPDSVLTRAQFCVFMIHTLGLKEQVATYAQKTLFRDVKPGSWYTGYVNLAYSNDLLSGYGNGLFGPDDALTYGQTATLLLRLLGYGSADVGRVWPADYVNFAHSLELDGGISLTANTPVTRGQAAVLLYNTLNTQPKGSSIKLYRQFKDTATIKQVILLDTDARNGTADHQLMVCVIGQAGTSVEYYSQKNLQSDALVGCQGDLLLNSADKVLGFMPSAVDTVDIKIDSVKASGITDTEGNFHKITGSAVTILGQDIYNWNTTGYIQVNSCKGKQARLYYTDNGNVSYVYVSSGVADPSQSVAVAKTHSSAQELARTLGLTGSYHITKNGSPATAGDLARYDTAYFDEASKTLCVSDYRLTGYIQTAVPALDGASSITLSGCTVPVLESAWKSLSDFRLGDRVTLLLTDDRHVAYALSPDELTSDMLGILSTDGRSVTLTGSGLVITAPEMDAEVSLFGSLVRCLVYDDSITALPFTGSVAGKLSISAGTLGQYSIAPSCAIYEQAGIGRGYVYSLDGVAGQPSADFDAIHWTDTLNASSIAAAHLNSAGQVDVLLLRDVTGNCYEYGRMYRYRGTDGILGGAVAGKPVYHDAITVTNAAGESRKYLSAFALSGIKTFYGISFRGSDSGNVQVTDLKELTACTIDASNILLQGQDEWSAIVQGYELPISSQVQLYIEPSDKWLAGEDAVKAAISSELKLTAYYDRTPTTGGQIRILQVEN